MGRGLRNGEEWEMVEDKPPIYYKNSIQQYHTYNNYNNHKSYDLLN